MDAVEQAIPHICNIPATVAARRLTPVGSSLVVDQQVIARYQRRLLLPPLLDCPTHGLDGLGKKPMDANHLLLSSHTADICRAIIREMYLPNLKASRLIGTKGTVDAEQEKDTLNRGGVLVQDA